MAGMIVWHELYTSDVDAATRFYSELLGAEIEASPMSDDFTYYMLKKGGTSHAGFVPKEHAEIPSHWYPYVHVDDVDATVEKATSLGAAVHSEPTTIPEMLRFAVLGDPQHASVGVIAPLGEGEMPSGLFAWDELHAVDVDAAKSFYGAVAGWTTEPFMEGYEAFNSGDTTVGGLMKERSNSPVSYWLSYFAVEDTDATAAKAMELGAGVTLPPETMEGVGRYAVLTDPTGAAFGIHQSANPS